MSGSDFGSDLSDIDDNAETEQESSSVGAPSLPEDLAQASSTQHSSLFSNLHLPFYLSSRVVCAATTSTKPRDVTRIPCD